MAHIIYRETSAAPSRSSDTVKGTALTNAEIDGNFKVVDDDINAINVSLSTKAEVSDALAFAIALG